MATSPEPRPYHEPTIPFAEQRSDLRAGIGRRVGENLDNRPGLWRLTSSPERPVQLYVGRNFLSFDECQSLCKQIDPNTYPSPLYDKEKYEGVRTSSTVRGASRSRANATRSASSSRSTPTSSTSTSPIGRNIRPTAASAPGPR
jgi:hypothetical protein